MSPYLINGDLSEELERRSATLGWTYRGRADYPSWKHGYDGWRVIVDGCSAAVGAKVSDIGYEFTVAALFPLETGPHLYLLRRNVIRSALAAMTSYQDLIVEHPAFDASYVVKATREDKAREFLSPFAQELHDQGLLVKSTHQHLELRRLAAPLRKMDGSLHFEPVQAALELAVAMVGHDRYGLEVLRGLPDVRERAPTRVDTLPTFEIHQPTAVQLSLHAQDGDRILQARAANLLANKAVDEQLRAACQAKAGDGAQLLISDKEVSLEWRDHLLPVEELLEAVIALARLASPGFSQGVFR